ncbi:MAG: sulfotransferase [Flavobacteriales bacterium]|nr:sulfotransferase [Flavobacteriales bacterium]
MSSGTDILQRPFLFVVGAPRSGTTWVHNLLAAHPQVAGLPGVELTLFSRYLAVPVSHFRRERADIDAGRWNQGLAAVWSDDQFAAHVRNFLSEVYDPIAARKPGATHVVDKHPNHVRHMSLIAEWLPKARFIHVIRDGREVAVSMMSVNRRKGHSPGELAEAARTWRDFIGLARKGAQELPGRVHEVRYEKLRTNGPEELARLLAACGLDHDAALVHRLLEEFDINRRQLSTGDAALNALRDKPDAIWRARLNARDRYRFHRWAGKRLCELGYAQPWWWADHAGQRLSIPATAFLWRCGRTLQQAVRGWRAAATDPFEPLP